MGDRLPLVPISGLVSPWVDSDLVAGALGVAGSVVRVHAWVDVAPSGGTCSFELRDTAAGGGTGITVTIPDGSQSVTYTGTALALAAGDTLYMRPKTANGAMGLSAWLEFAESGMAALTTALTTLARVKDRGGIASATHDTRLNEMIISVSDAMQRWMGRQILQSSIVAEKHDANGIWDTIYLHHAPVVTDSETVTQDGTALVRDTDYELEAGVGALVKLSGGKPEPWLVGRRIVAVDYTAGFASVPGSLIEAATDQVRHQFSQSQPSGQDRLGKDTKAVSTGGVVSYSPHGFLPGVIEVMRTFRRLV